MDHRLALAIKLYDQGLPDAAWLAVHELARAPDAASDVLQFAGELCLLTARHEEALALADRRIAREPCDHDAHLVRGRALRELDRFDDALAAFARSAALKTPDAVLHFNLGLLHQRAGRLAESEQAYRAALGLAPDGASIWNNLGLLLEQAGRPEEARLAFLKSIALAPDVSATHNNHGAVLASQGLYAAAAAAHLKALEIDPRNVAARINLGVAQLEQGHIDDARRTFDTALAQGAFNRDAADNRLYLDSYAETDPARICARHHAWGQEFHLPVPAPRVHRKKPLKVAYVSADFRRHSVSFFVEALLRHHDPREVEVHCYSGAAQPDEVTARLRALVPDAPRRWHDVVAWDDERLRRAIGEAAIDILIDLSGHTSGNRLGVFARRAAPLQVSALGYPATTGVAAMDYRLCDTITDPPGSEDFSTEKLMRLHALHCFTPPPDAPEPAAGGHRAIVFGSFNKLAKLSESCVRLWAGVLRAVPDSRLVLKCKALAEEATRAAVAGRFAAHGIALGRLDLRGWQAGDAQHLRAYGDIDIALDTFPYNGTTTTCEALWMGVPVITLAGRTHAARVGASLLASAGRGMWCAETDEDFTALAVRTADRAALAQLRMHLRAELRASRLCDGASYTHDVESAYRAMCDDLKS